MIKKKTPMNLRTKVGLLQFAGVLVCIAPIIVVVGINFKEYFYQASGIQVGFGGMLALILLVMMAKDKAKFLKGVWGYLIVFLIAVFLKPILDDVILLTGMALVGKSADAICIAPTLKKCKEKLSGQAIGENIDSNFTKIFKEQIALLGGGKHE